MRSMDLLGLAEDFAVSVGFINQFRRRYQKIRVVENVRNSVLLAMNDLGLDDRFQEYLDKHEMVA